LEPIVPAKGKTRGSGRISFTGSIAGFMPGTYQAVYNCTKAFIDSFALALRVLITPVYWYQVTMACARTQRS
jgi:short-subunit dehydrogenase